MAGTNNFKVFDETMSGIMSDTNYSASDARMNGVQNNTAADPLLHNKYTHQATIMAAAFAQIAANQGLNVSDSDLNTLIQVIQQAFATVPYANSAADKGNTIYDAFHETADVGTLSMCGVQPAPSAPSVSASMSGVLSGTYRYVTVLVTGYVTSDGVYHIKGFSPSVDSASVSLSNQSCSVANISLGNNGTIARAIYRTVAGGAAGTEKFLALITDNSTTTFTDNTPDSSLGQIPTSGISGVLPPTVSGMTNTTGSTLQWTSDGTVKGAIFMFPDGSMYLEPITQLVVRSALSTSSENINVPLMNYGDIRAVTGNVQADGELSSGAGKAVCSGDGSVSVLNLKHDSGTYVQLLSGDNSGAWLFNVSSSDKNMKENIQTSSEDALGKLMMVVPRSFDWKKEFGGGHRKLGVIAQELKSVDDQFAVSTKQPNGEERVFPNEPVLSVYYLRAIQQLNEKIELLSDRIAKLEKQ